MQFSKYCQYLKEYDWFKDKAVFKNTIDVVGVKGNFLNSRQNTVDKYKVMGYESKASYQDFLNGFCCQCEYTYVIAPKGIIPVDKIPAKIGLIEIDLENYTIKRNNRAFEFTGIETTKQCSSRKKELYKKDEIYRIHAFNVLKSVAYRSTVNDLFKNNEIMVKGL